MVPFLNLSISLYKPLGFNYFMHRNAYRIFYSYSQLVPESMRPYKSLIYEQKVEEIFEGQQWIKRQHLGKPTKTQRKIDAYTAKIANSLGRKPKGEPEE